MMKEQLLEKVKQAFDEWSKEQFQDSVLYPDHVEGFFSDYLYEDLVDIQGEPAEFIGEYVKIYMEYAESVLQELKIKKEAILLENRNEMFERRLLKYREKYTRIQQENEPERTILLSGLMDELKVEFSIPLLNDEQYNERNKPVIDFYREVSGSRSLFDEGLV